MRRTAEVRTEVKGQDPGPGPFRPPWPGDSGSSERGVSRLGDVTGPSAGSQADAFSWRAAPRHGEAPDPEVAFRRSVKLTPEQATALYIATSRGYYDFPRKVSLSQLARAFGVSPSSMSEVLRGAEREVMAKFVLSMQVPEPVEQKWKY